MVVDWCCKERKKKVAPVESDSSRSEHACTSAQMCQTLSKVKCVKMVNDVLQDCEIHVCCADRFMK